MSSQNLKVDSAGTACSRTGQDGEGEDSEVSSPVLTAVAVCLTELSSSLSFGSV